MQVMSRYVKFDEVLRRQIFFTDEQSNTPTVSNENDMESESDGLSILSEVLPSVDDEIKKRLKEKENKMLDQYRVTTVDSVRLHDEGWKARYYEDPPKRDDLLMGGGKKRMCETYVQGLCWVLKYYYEVCSNWYLCFIRFKLRER
jgi:5'-3' exonuclease